MVFFQQFRHTYAASSHEPFLYIIMTNKLHILLFLLLTGTSLLGQDLNGHWEGYLSQTVNGQREQVHFELQLTQRGNHFSGAAMTAKDDSTTCTTLIRSIWNEGFLYYKDLKFIKIRGNILEENWCLKECTFKYEVSDGQAWLIGNWTGKTALEERCQPGMIKLSRKKETKPNQQIGSVEGAPQEVDINLSTETNITANANIELLGLSNDFKELNDISTGSSSIKLSPGKYEVWINSRGYHQILLSKMVGMDKNIWNFSLKPILQGDKFTIQGLNFEQSQAIIAKESQKALDRLLLFMQENQDLKVAIVGHTDNVGNSYLNRILSLNRARAVARYLVSNGIDIERIETDGLGGEEPIATNDSESGRSINRRVEVEVISYVK